MKQVLAELFFEVLERIRVDRVMSDSIQLDAEGRTLHVCGERIELDPAGTVCVIAFGKAARGMARSLAGKLAEIRLQGLLVVPEEDRGEPVPGLEEIRGGHPLPTEGSFRAAERIEARLAALGDRDLALFLVSGGGSSLIERPARPDVSAMDWARLYAQLVRSGEGIEAINVVRKHLSKIKGGALAAAARPARQVTVYLSDVPAGCDASVASGPTMPDESTAAEAARLARSMLDPGTLPGAVRWVLDEEALVETLEPDDPAFARSSWHRLLSNDDAVELLAERARARGWHVEVDRTVDEAPVDLAVEHLVSRLDIHHAAHPDRPVAVVAGGEARCRPTGPGRGGRNQAFVLRAVPRIAGRPIAVLSAGTDGIDGNSPAAGAVADGRTADRAQRAGLDTLEADRASDSFTFFDRLSDTLILGPTSQNIRDLRLLFHQ